MYKTFELCPEAELSPYKTFECGQCFRWNDDGSGAYVGVASGRAARVYAADGAARIECADGDLDFWRVYLDMDTDYAAARESVMIGDYLTECAEYGAGIRILRQDKWEALCSFIISQCNNIPRIKGIVEKLCALFGEAFDTPWGVRYSFPPASRVALLEEPELAPLRAGYRAAYIIGAARAVASVGALSELPGALRGELSGGLDAVILPELLRLLLDERRMGWDDAVCLVSECFDLRMAGSGGSVAVPLGAVAALQPRTASLIRAVNDRLCSRLWDAWPGDWRRIGESAVIRDEEVYTETLCAAMCAHIFCTKERRAGSLRSMYILAPARFTDI